MDGLNLKIGDSTMEIIKLRELADIQTGPFGSQLHKEDYVQVGTPIVTVEHLGKRVFTEQNLPHVDNKDKIRLKKYSLLEGDIVFSRVGAIDRSSYVDKEHEGWLFSGRCLRIRPYRKVYPLYLYYYLQLERVKSFIRSIAVGATMPSINTSILGKVNILVPEIAVQKNIAKQMAILDDKIELSNDLNRKLQQFRQAMLTKLFPREGAVEPELRFRGFSGKWKCKILRELADFYSGGTPTVGIKEYYSGNIPFIRSAEIHSAKTALYISDEGLNCSSARMVKKGDILYALYGATSGEVGRAKLTGAINQAILAILPNKNCDADFLTQWLHKSKINILSTYLQGGQGNLSGEIIKNLRILLPTLEEQRKIGNFFRRLDDLISVQQKKLERMQRLKSALLEKMFV